MQEAQEPPIDGHVSMTYTSRRLLYGLRAVLLLLVALGVARVTLFTVYRVAGTSMETTFEDGDRILVCESGWLTGAPEPGDTVIATVDGETLVKRVVAGPGDRLAILFGSLILNGEVVDEQIPVPMRRIETVTEHELGADEYFVLGDHRRVSIDSRDFGPISREQIRGEVLLRFSTGGISGVAALARD